MQLIFYDSEQSVRPSDIDQMNFKYLIQKHVCESIDLQSQLRCKGGNDYIAYVKSVLGETETVKHKHFADYELKFFEDPNEMIQVIKEKDSQLGLCRTVAGYGWKWESKKDAKAMDIWLDGVGYQWNKTAVDWINSENSINEIGCIHTVQGYDLNIVGVIFGPEIRYDRQLKTIVIDKSSYFDTLGKTKDPEAQKEFIVNIYATLMTRGIKGTYVYAYDPGLRDYLREYFG